MIPRRLVRTVPAETSTQVEQWWQQACDLHPDWEHETWREPVDPDDFPLTGHLFATCETGAQKADLIRAERLWWVGGCYADSDYVALRPFDSLLGVPGFAAYEDRDHIPNAVMGFEANHPALQRVIELAIQRHGQGTWAAGVGVTTEVFRADDTVLLLPPGSFYAVHWRDAHKTGVNVDEVRAANPWAFGVHMYAHSWVSKESPRRPRERPRGSAQPV